MSASNSRTNSPSLAGLIFASLKFAAFLLIGINTVSCIGVKMGVVGPNLPYAPRVYYEDIQNVVIKDVEVNTIRIAEGPVFNAQSRLAVLNFKSPGETQGGYLVSDMFASILRSNGYTVVERAEIERILDEQRLIEEGQVALSDLDIAQALGRLETIDYLVLGAATLYKSEAQSVYLPIRMREEDRPRYTEQYNIYRDWYLVTVQGGMDRTAKLGRL